MWGFSIRSADAYSTTVEVRCLLDGWTPECSTHVNDWGTPVRREASIALDDFALDSSEAVDVGLRHVREQFGATSEEVRVELDLVRVEEWDWRVIWRMRACASASGVCYYVLMDAVTGEMIEIVEDIQ